MRTDSACPQGQRKGLAAQSISVVVLAAYKHDAKIDMTKRRAGEVHERGYSTKVINWINIMVRKGFLIPEHKSKTPKQD